MRCGHFLQAAMIALCTSAGKTLFKGWKNNFEAMVFRTSSIFCCIKKVKKWRKNKPNIIRDANLWKSTKKARSSNFYLLEIFHHLAIKIFKVHCWKQSTIKAVFITPYIKKLGWEKGLRFYIKRTSKNTTFMDGVYD